MSLTKLLFKTLILHVQGGKILRLAAKIYHVVLRLYLSYCWLRERAARHIFVIWSTVCTGEVPISARRNYSCININSE